MLKSNWLQMVNPSGLEDMCINTHPHTHSQSNVLLSIYDMYVCTCCIFIVTISNETENVVLSFILCLVLHECVCVCVCTSEQLVTSECLIIFQECVHCMYVCIAKGIR